MNITEGDKVFIDIINNTIVITPVPKNISELSGIAKGLYEEDYIEKERSKWDWKFFNKVLPYFRKAETKDVELYTSSLSYMELLIPAIKNKDVNLEAKYNFLFKNFFNVVNINMETARIGAKLRAGYGIRTPDVLQIACAIRLNCRQFITSDRRLKKIIGIEIVVIS